MTATDAVFAGAIPSLYDRYLGPLLFAPYAEEVARRAQALMPGHILETAAGTGIVTVALHGALPDAEIIATDLNPAMIAVAAQRVQSDKVHFEQADAQDLRFADASFDLAVCQFGVMFFPDKPRANREARRVLRDGGRYLLVIWDRIERNPASQLLNEAVAMLYPDDSPAFLARTPFGYADRTQIEQDLFAAGFADISFETVALESRESSPREAAIGLVHGSPLRNEIEQRDGDFERATDAAEKALEGLSRDGRFVSELSAHIVTSIK